MSIIQIFTDETNGKNFQIISTIWGYPDNCKLFSNRVHAIIKKNPRLNNEFKGLHSRNLNNSNWNTLGITFQEVINELYKLVLTNKINFEITVIDNYKLEANAKHLSNVFKNLLEAENSELRKILKSFSNEDLPALYHRLAELFIFLIHRDKIGNDGDFFEFYPDSRGKELEYIDKLFQILTTNSRYQNVKFVDLIVLFGNACLKGIDNEGWPKKKQLLIKYEPLKWSNNYIIQTCDILANFFLSYLYFKLGHSKEIYQLKSKALTQDFSNDININEVIGLFKIDFETGNIYCTEKDIMFNLSF